MNIKNTDIIETIKDYKYLETEMKSYNKYGTYTQSSISLCNTKKNHGLFVTQLNDASLERHVLLSGLDETIFQFGCEYHLGLHRYQNTDSLGRIRYIKQITLDPVFQINYCMGPIEISKQIIVSQSERRIYVKYTLIEAKSAIALMLQPFLAFRQLFELNYNDNLTINSKHNITSGIKIKTKQNYPFLYMQFSKDNSFVSQPEWYYNIQYNNPLTPDSHYFENLFVPGFFTTHLREGEAIVFTAGLQEINPQTIGEQFIREYNQSIQLKETLRTKQQSTINTDTQKEHVVVR